MKYIILLCLMQCANNSETTPNNSNIIENKKKLSNDSNKITEEKEFFEELFLLLKEKNILLSNDVEERKISFSDLIEIIEKEKSIINLKFGGEEPLFNNNETLIEKLISYTLNKKDKCELQKRIVALIKEEKIEIENKILTGVLIYLIRLKDFNLIFEALLGKNNLDLNYLVRVKDLDAPVNLLEEFIKAINAPIILNKESKEFESKSIEALNKLLAEKVINRHNLNRSLVILIEKEDHNTSILRSLLKEKN